jgi:hypothetical protein
VCHVAEPLVGLGASQRPARSVGGACGGTQLWLPSRQGVDTIPFGNVQDNPPGFRICECAIAALLIAEDEPVFAQSGEGDERGRT